MRFNQEINREERARVYLGIPTHDGRIQNEIVNSILGAGQSLARIQIEGGSALTCNFNNCYATALNNRDVKNGGKMPVGQGVTHFAMLHSDIAVVGNGWLDELVTTARIVDADVLSVVMRLKREPVRGADGSSDGGMTSTAIEENDDVGRESGANPLGFKARKLTLKECLERGDTWTDPGILINTGLMLVNICKPWSDKVWFEFRDGLGCKDGTYFPVSLAEDYGFSRMVRREGGRIFATTAIKATHVGGGRWENRMPMEPVNA